MSLSSDTFVPYWSPEPSDRRNHISYRGGVGEEVEFRPDDPTLIHEGGVPYFSPSNGAGAYNSAFVGVKTRGPNYIPLDYLDEIVEEEERKVGDSGDEGHVGRKNRRLMVAEGEFDSRSQNSQVSGTPTHAQNDETPSGSAHSPLDSSKHSGIFWTSTSSTSTTSCSSSSSSSFSSFSSSSSSSSFSSSSSSSSSPSSSITFLRSLTLPESPPESVTHFVRRLSGSFPTPNPKLERHITEVGTAKCASWVQKYKFDYKEREAITTSLSSGTDDFYWNRQFQRILDLPEDTSANTNTKYRLLAQLAVDFVDTAQTYGKVIISELLLPDHRKSITPSRNLPGVAGGVKYIVRGILFKLAQDESISETRYVYGGSDGPNDECAAKGAGHDLKGANAYLKYSLQIRKYSACGPFFRLPMEALIDYRGHRLIAMSLVPVGKLVYGSSDGGRVVHNTDEFNFMKNAAEYLHLAEHFVRKKKLWCAGDVELHEASHADGDLRRFYLIDLARAMPPEFHRYCSHIPGVGHTEFYRLFRPEYLQIRKKNGLQPLSPDGLTGWSTSQTDSRDHSKRIAQATLYLIRTIIPEFAAEIDRTGKEDLQEKDLKQSRRDSGAPETTGPTGGGDPLNASTQVRAILSLPVSEQVHRRGINIRHIGLLRNFIKTNEKARRTLFIELVGRTLKNVLRAWLREAMKNFPKGLEPSESYFRWTAACFCNLVSGSHSQSRSFWKEVYAGLVLRYGEISLSEDEKNDLFAAAKPDLFQIIKHVLNMTHIHLSSLCQKHLSAENGEETYGFYFTPSDIESMAVRVKHMPLLDYAKAKLLLNEAFGSDLSLRASGRLLELSIAFLKDVLRSDTMNISAEQDQCLARCLANEHSQQFEEADKEILLAVTIICAKLNQRGIDEDDNDGEFAKIVEVGIYLLQAQQGIWKRRTSTKIFAKLAEVIGKDLPPDLPEIKGGRFQNFGGASSLKILRWHGDCLLRLKPQLVGASADLLRYYEETTNSRQHSINVLLHNLSSKGKNKQKINQQAIENSKIISPPKASRTPVDDWLNRSPVAPTRQLRKEGAVRSLDVSTPESPSTSGSSPSPLTLFPDRPLSAPMGASSTTQSQERTIPATPATPIMDRAHSYESGGRPSSSLLPSSASTLSSPSTPLTKHLTCWEYMEEIGRDGKSLPQLSKQYRMDRRASHIPTKNNSYFVEKGTHKKSNSVGGTNSTKSNNGNGIGTDEPNIHIPPLPTTPSRTPTPSSTLSDSDTGQTSTMTSFSAPTTPLLQQTLTSSSSSSASSSSRGLRERKSQIMRFAREPTFTLAPQVSPPPPFRTDVNLNVFSHSEFVSIPEIYKNTLISYARLTPPQRHQIFKAAIDSAIRQGDLLGIQILVEIEAACASCFTVENTLSGPSDHGEPEPTDSDPPSPLTPLRKGLFELGPGTSNGDGDGERRVTSRSHNAGGNGVGEDFLVQSILQKTIKKVICLLSAGIDPRSTDGGNPLLHFAVEIDSLPIVKILIEAKAHINARNEYGETPLLQAVFMQRSVEMVQCLINAKANINAVDKWVQNGLFSSSILTKKREKYRWNSAVCKLLLQSKMDPNQKNLDGMTPLHYWIQSPVSPQRLEAIKLLCKYADVNMANPHGITPMLALCEIILPRQSEKQKEAQNQNSAILQCLIATRVDVNATDQKTISPIVQLLTGGQEEEKKPLIDRLFEAKCDLNARYINETTLLMLVAKRPFTLPMKLLLHHDVDLDAVDTHGQCALHYAVSEGNPEIVKLLVDASASVNLKDKFGLSPADNAQVNKEKAKKENKHDQRKKFRDCHRILREAGPPPPPPPKPLKTPKPPPRKNKGPRWGSPRFRQENKNYDGGGGGSSGGGAPTPSPRKKSISLNKEKEKDKDKDKDKENGGGGGGPASSSSRGSGVFQSLQQVVKGVMRGGS